jgi:apolipoprotein N-acyltransferase
MIAYALSLLAGAVLPFAFAPFEQFWIAPLSYAALFYAWRGVSSRRAFGVGFAYGCASFGCGTYWIYIAVHDMGGAPIALAVALTVGLTLVLAAFVGAAGFIAARWFRTSGAAAWLVTLPVLFVLTEWTRGWLFTGFGWLSAGYSQTDSWLMGYAPLLGLHGMSWAVLAIAGALVTLGVWVADTRSGRAPARVGAAAAAGAAIALVGIFAGGAIAGSRAWTTPKEKTLSVALIQGAIAQDVKWKPEQLPGMLALYAGLTQQNLGTDLIVWPEAAVPTLVEYVRPYLDGVRRAAEARDSTVLLGILHRDPGAPPENAQNVLIALTEPPQTYIKRHLVPFGEYFPVPSFIRSWLRLMNLPYNDILPATDDQPAIVVGDERVAITICYEDVFGSEQLQYLPNATLLVNVSNDAWFGDSIAPHQHLQIARLRAAEAGRWLLRATNTGVTAVIDPRGRVAQTVPQFEATVLKHTVQGYTGATPYVRWGNWFVIVTALAALLTQVPSVTKRAGRGRN